MTEQLGYKKDSSSPLSTVEIPAASKLRVVVVGDQFAWRRAIALQHARSIPPPNEQPKLSRLLLICPTAFFTPDD